jgi:cyanophycin synthetase
VVLRRAGLPVPDHEVVATIDDAVMAAGRIGYPVVVKPVDRDGGKGVAVDLDSPAAVRAAAAAVLRLSRGVLVERFVPGTDYRLQVHRGEVIWASQRTPGGVTGDGVHSVATLLERLNADPKRDPTAVATLLKQIPLDEEARELLARQGLTPDAVPEAGRFVRLRRAANVAMGGTAEGVLDRVHPDNRELAVRAAEALRLDLAGIDLIIPDIARSWLEGGAGICEVNAQPQLWPTLPELILKRLIRGTGRIPVTVVVGTPEQAPWAAAFAAALTARGEPTGWVSRSGATLGATTIMPGPLDLFVGGEAVFFDRRVRGVILFVEDDRVLRTGLPCDRCDRLVLVGGPAHAAAWPAWLGVARFLAAMCAGDIVVRDDDPRWRPLAAMLPGRRLTPLPIAEINRMMGRPHVA